MTVHKGPVFMTDDDHARAHELAMKRTLNLIARLLEEDGCPDCARTLRHVASSYTTVPLNEAP
jgi:hypothetical protein